MLILIPPLYSLLQSRTHRFATLYRITRRDGTVFRFTNHDSTIHYANHDYLPAGGFDSSARQRTDGLKDRNFEAFGMITSDAITFDDLRGGLFRQAMVEIMLIDWMYPWADPYELNRYWIASLGFSGEAWEAQLEGITHKLKQNVGRSCGRKCDVENFGDEHCDPGGLLNLAVSNTGNFTVGTVDPSYPKRQFSCNVGVTTGDWWKGGRVTWLTGANTGVTVGINANVGNVLTLWLDTPFNNESGDTFEAVVGCDRTPDTCYTKFDNIKNFQGFPTVPGTDAILTTPDAKL